MAFPRHRTGPMEVSVLLICTAYKETQEFHFLRPKLIVVYDFVALLLHRRYVSFQWNFSQSSACKIRVYYQNFKPIHQVLRVWQYFVARVLWPKQGCFPTPNPKRPFLAVLRSTPSRQQNEPVHAKLSTPFRVEVTTFLAKRYGNRKRV